ncbi:hypothetical protein QNI19_12220 [Cytophagaceae bacterium DM2B3-1]|uniref:Uncharacterized protein n=1 Tax=Xanthocytophaga flava TaxID=3048013 RepID=A0ABT7CIZ0_9BACT|nr:hypothetical protein [Xanthocytophaga flavus]MDJ1493699.1 hypothetical protein [Xanthocytophaga flavus]
MLHSITWPSYLITLLIVAVCYYLIIGIRFYSQESIQFFTKKIKAKKLFASSSPTYANTAFRQEEASPSESTQMELSFADTSDDLFEQVGQLIHKLKATIKEAATSNPDKVPLIDSLTDILGEYDHLKGTQFQSAISELIQNECEDLGFPTFSEDQIRRLWE